MAELADLAALEMLATWDQMVMMPSEGAAARAHQLGALSRVAHERATDDDIGEWLAGLEDAQLDEVGRDIARLARRDWERSRRVPAELAAERSRAYAAGQEAWQRARANDDFSSFAPALELNVELARAYGECLAQGGDGPYQALLADHDYGHALYERQIDPALARTNLGRGTSMSMHESQSKLWENHVARSPAFAEVLAAELGTAGFPVTAGELRATLTGVEPSLIRVSAD